MMIVASCFSTRSTMVSKFTSSLYNTFCLGAFCRRIVLGFRQYKRDDPVVAIQFVVEFSQMIAQRWFPLTLFHRVNDAVRIVVAHAPNQCLHDLLELDEGLCRRERSQNKIRTVRRFNKRILHEIKHFHDVVEICVRDLHPCTCIAQNTLWGPTRPWFSDG